MKTLACKTLHACLLLGDVTELRQALLDAIAEGGDVEAAAEALAAAKPPRGAGSSELLKVSLHPTGRWTFLGLRTAYGGMIICCPPPAAIVSRVQELAFLRVHRGAGSFYGVVRSPTLPVPNGALGPFQRPACS